MPAHPKLTGLTLAAGTTSLSLKIIGFRPPGSKVELIDFTDFADTHKDYRYGDIIDNGTLTVVAVYDSDLDFDTHVGVSQTWTLTHPIVDSATNSDAADKQFSGAVIEFSPNSAGIDELPTMDVEIAVSGDVTVDTESV